MPAPALHVALIHGPNLNLLGTREPGVYGTTTLDDINRELEALATGRGATLSAFQSNHEGAIIDHIHGLAGTAHGIVINPGGLTHTSVALRDALLGVALPYIEVHLSNTFARESFRHRSMLASAAAGLVIGFGPGSYKLGLLGLLDQLS